MMADQSKTYLRVSLFDKSKAPLGKVKMDLDWVRSEWSIREDENCWDRVGFSRKGQFEHKDWGVLWIWDGPNGDKNTMIIRDGPNRDMDLLYNSGFGSLFEPYSTPLKGCDFEWTKLTAPASAAPPAAGKTIRDEVQTLLDANVPLIEKEPANWLESKVGRVKIGNATGCGGMPSTVIVKLGANRFIADKVTLSYQEDVSTQDPVTKVVTTVKTNQTKTLKVTDPMIGWKQFAEGLEKKFNRPAETHWIPFKPGNDPRLPKTGDILILKKTSGKNGDFAHVCVIHSVDGNKWRTADGGQGKGYAIAMRNKVVNFSTGTVASDAPGNDIRYVDGWVDLESLLAKK
jgi:hypothetical protein